MLFKKGKKDKTQLNEQLLPLHIAFIMDGNGRWAKRRGLPRTAGHSEGGKALLKIINACNDLHIKAITVYAFSTENWKRPLEEVNFLMELPRKYINTYLPKIKESNIRMNFIGDIASLPADLQEDINRSVAETKDNTGLIFTTALNYGSHKEILDVAKNIALEYKEGSITLADVTEDYFNSKLSTANLPPVDLLIRTSGELRISNFLMWQIAYSELYFTDKYWPDFSVDELYKALLDYQNRNRRFGGIK